MEFAKAKQHETFFKIAFKRAMFREKEILIRIRIPESPGHIFLAACFAFMQLFIGAKKGQVWNYHPFRRIPLPNTM